MGPTWSPSGADTTQAGPMLAPWTLLSGYKHLSIRLSFIFFSNYNPDILINQKFGPWNNIQPQTISRLYCLYYYGEVLCWEMFYHTVLAKSLLVKRIRAEKLGSDIAIIIFLLRTRFINNAILKLHSQDMFSQINQTRLQTISKHHIFEWASCLIGKIADCACAGNAGNVFSATDFRGNRELAIPACIMARATRTYRNACLDH